MSRSGLYNRSHNLIRQRRREIAVERVELRADSSPRQAASGPVSPPIKIIPPELRAMIDAAARAKGIET